MSVFPQSPYVVGIDSSLTGTGVATAGPCSIAMLYGHTGVTTQPLAQRIESVRDIAVTALNMALSPRDADGALVLDLGRVAPALVVIEAPDTSRRYGGLVERLGLYWEIVGALHNLRIPIAAVPSPILKGYATGSGGSKDGKQRVIAAVARWWPEYGVKDNNMCDAAVLAQMGLEHLTGASRVPPEHSEWLGRPGITWPAECGQ